MLGKVLAITPVERERNLQMKILQWFSKYRYPWFRGKRRLGMIQKSSILSLDHLK